MRIRAGIWGVCILTLSAAAGCQRISPADNSDGTVQGLSEGETGTETENADSDLVTLVVDNPALTQEKLVALNGYLLEQGCTYQIEGIDTLEMTAEEKGISSSDVTSTGHAEYIERYLDEGGQIDIVHAAELMFSNGHWSFSELWADGYLECLEEYMETEKGGELYAAMPEAYWQTLRANSSGKLYGICGYPYGIKTNPVYFVNPELMKKYGLTEEDLTKPLDELEGLLEEIQEQEGASGEFYAVKLMYDNYWYDNVGLYQFNSNISGILLDEDRQDDPVVWLYDDEGIVELLEDVYCICQNQNISMTINTAVDMDQYFLLVDLYGNAGCSPPSGSGYCSAAYNDDGILLYPYGDQMVIREKIPLNCVTAQSAYKEEAFDFLCRVYTDRALTEMLAFGTDLEEKDGQLQHTDGTEVRFAAYIYIGNGFIGRPAAGEFINKTELLTETYEQAAASCYAGFWLSEGSLGWLAGVGAATVDITPLLSGEYDSVKTFIDEKRQSFYDAEGEELLRLVREAYDAFYED